MTGTSITIKNTMKRFGDVTVIPNLSLKIQPGEFFTLLGPSGCGKTTLLRMIAGFNTIEGGEIYFNETVINDLDPGKRNIGMVFQNYAIFPHMNVRKNVEFGLRQRKVHKKEMDVRVERALKYVQIEEYAERRPDHLSGGQQQRVALARALVIEPAVLLMDEPLSNLDAKLRLEMRAVIKDIQHKVGITTIYVTHDQEEAMAISDRIAVMKEGVIQHIGSPKDIYQRPANQYVATFIGRSNLIPGELKIKENKCYLVFPDGYTIFLENVQQQYRKEQPVVISARPEELLLQGSEDAEGFAATVEDSVFLGPNTHYFVRLTAGEQVEIIQESTFGNIIQPGTKIKLTVKDEKVNVFLEDGSANILTGVNNQTFEE